MNYYKNTRAKGVALDNNGFFAVEQITATIAMVLAGYVLFNSTEWFNTANEQLVIFRRSIAEPHPEWGWGVLAGTAFGMVAFFSVFIFMFKKEGPPPLRDL